jgi:hypothetical protein
MPRTALFTLPLLLSLLAALALALTAAPRPATAQGFVKTPSWHLTPTPVAKKKRRRPRTNGRKIACTRWGCHRIPYGCYPTTEYDFWGNPTGYDAIVCPRRR